MTRWLPGLLLILVPGVAQANVWTDPGFARAVGASDLIVRAQAPANGSRGRTRVTFRIQTVLKGTAPTEVRVANLHDPTRGSGPVFAPGEQVYLLLLRDTNGYRVPTPTMGRFPVRGSKVRFVALRDTFLRVDLDREDFESWVRLHLGQRDSAWLDGLRRDLLRGRDPARILLALEALALVAKRRDARLVAPYLTARPYPMRISACRAYARTRGRSAARVLLRRAATDREPAVRTEAIRLLGKLDPPGLVSRLAVLLPHAPDRTIHFSGPADPRLNTWPSPKEALIRVIAARDPRAARVALSRVLDEPSAPLEVRGAAIKALSAARRDGR